MATVAYGSLPFKQQIAFFRQKTNVLTDSWLDLWEAQHDNGFMVAGANRIDLLADLHQAVRATVEDGETLAQFRARFDSIVAKHGWDYNGGRNWRSRVIYETNLRQSYNAGRWHQEQQLKTLRPWKQYKHSDAVEHPRPVHQSWDGKVWHVDDPVWKVIHPQNGWGCQCYTQLLNDRDLKKLGKTGPDAPLQLQWVDVMVGQRSPGGPRLVRTVEGIDPGFAYAPGSSLDTWPKAGPKAPRTPPALQRTLVESAQDALRKSARLPAAAAAAALGEIFALRRAQDALQAGYAEFQAYAAGGSWQGARYMVGMFDDVLLQAMGARGITPATAAIAIRDAEILQSLASGADAAAMAALPAYLRSPLAVLWDASRAELLYLATDGTRLLLARVGVTGALPEVRGVSMLDNVTALERFPLLRGSLE
ncbi:phage minor head protein [Thermomonas sp.]|uniref:phage head morphogenesis protein n=1 Tax=Thermomonas sp. TaxID=1971895 RepID=UPI00391A30B6